MTQYNAHADRDVKRMFCAILRDLQGEVRSIDNLLRDSCDLISEYYSIFLTWRRNESVKHHRADSLLCTDNSIAFFLESADCIHSITYMLPLHAILGTKCGLMNLSRRRHGADTAKPYFIYLERISGPESRAHIMSASDVIQDQHDAGFGQLLILLRRHPSKLNI